MKIEIDISGQIQQKNYDSALGFCRDNGIEKAVYLKSEAIALKTFRRRKFASLLITKEMIENVLFQFKK